MAGSPKTAADLKAKEAQAANFEQEKALRAAQTREGEAKATLAEQGLAQASRTQKTKEEILRLRKQAKNLTPEQRDKMLGQAQDLEDEMAYLTSGSAGPREQLPAAAQFAEWGVGKRVFPGRKEALDYYNTAKDRSPEAQRAELFKLVAQADKLATPEEIRSRVDELAPVFFGAPRTAMPLAASPALRGSPAATGGPAVKQPGARLIGKSAKDGRNVWENPDGTRVKGD